MAKSRFSIIMDYRNAMRQAEKIADAANELATRQQEIEQYINTIRTGWTGDNALMYTKKLEVSKMNIEKLQKKLNNIAEVVKRIARRTYETEMATLEISQRRSYH